MGKDYYLPDLFWFYPFKFHLDTEVYPNSISSTNPYNVTRIMAKHPGLGSEDEEEASLLYELNKDHLLSKVTFHNKQHPGPSITRIFTY